MKYLRILSAVIGSSIITIALILFMNDLIGGNFIRSPIRYLPVFDVIMLGNQDQERLQRPPSAESRPTNPQLDYDPLFDTEEEAQEQ